MKEIPKILKMELQNESTFKKTIKPIIDSLKENELMLKLSNTRNFLVHQGQLEIESSGCIGTTEGGEV